MRDKTSVPAAFAVAACMAMALTAAPSLASPFRLAAFGDSLMDGYDLGSTEGFIPQMGAKLAGMGIEVEMIDHASSGDTTADGLARLDEVIRSSPDGVLLSLGSNDALRSVNPDAVAQNLDALLAGFKDAGIPVMLVGAKAPLNWGPVYKGRFDDVYPDLADEHDVPLYPFILEGVAFVPSLNLADGLHPNPAGIGVMVDMMAPQVAEFIKSI